MVSSAVRVAVSEYTTTILLSDGSAMSAGTNFEGCLGDNSQFNSTALIPVNVNGLKDIVDIKATTENIIALDKNGDVYFWGSAVGTGIVNSKTAYFPKKIPTLMNIIAISGCAPGYHFLALDSNHNCFGWGSNSFGQLGDTTIFNFNTPTLIATDAVDIIAGRTFSYIIKTDGTLWASGSSYYGSIWMNLNNVKRGQLTQLNPNLPPFNLCNPSPFTPRILTLIDVSICPGDSFTVGEKTYKTGGNYRDTLPGALNIDSIILTHITIHPISNKTQTISICPGGKFSIGANTYSTAGTYKDTFSNYRGCDSILTTQLKIYTPATFTQSISLCKGGTYTVGKSTYISSGSFLDTLNNFNGCDSFVITNISIKPIPVFIQNIAICAGEMYAIGQHNYSTPGVYIDTLANPYGCDSIVYTTLNINSRPEADFYFRDNPPDMHDTVLFYNLSKGANAYLWHFGISENDTSTLTNPLFIYPVDGKKYIQLISINVNTGCKDTVIKEIEVIDNSVIYIPSAFSPNGDGINDFFYPVSKNYDRIISRVYNRWGELVYESAEFSPGWDGKFKGENCQQGRYMYIIEFSNTINHKEKTVTGGLTLLRQ